MAGDHTKGDHTEEDTAASPRGVDADRGRPPLSRRQVIGRMSTVAAAGAAAWVVPEILTAKPASGATLSGPSGNSGTGTSVGVSTSVGTSGGSGASAGAGARVDADPATKASTTGGVSKGSGSGASGSPGSLAFTGLSIERDAEVGAALVAAGWAMQHWASRIPKAATAVEGGDAAGGTATVS
jgi:hypothetical protein